MIKRTRFFTLVICLSIIAVVFIINRIKIQERLYPWLNPLEVATQLNVLDQRMLDKGKHVLSQQKMIICGISRDNATDFWTMRRHIEHLGNQCNDYKVVIVENDSKDGTKELLKHWADCNPHVTIISKDFHNKKRPSIQFLANVRNLYIDEINQSNYDDFNLLVVIDMDMSYGFDIRGIYHSFATLESWDAMASNGISNQKGEMYDAFAFRNNEFPFSLYDKPETYWSDIVPKIQRAYPVNSSLIPVNSAFGGLAIYKRNKLKGCRYHSIKGDCEHIELHKFLVEAMSDHRSDERIAIAGASNLARYSDNFDSAVRPLLEALEEHVVLLKLMGAATEGGAVTVRIGAEGPYEKLSSTSVVTTGYGPAEESLAMLGVVGPTRMDYPGTMAAVRAVASYVSRILDEA